MRVSTTTKNKPFFPHYQCGIVVYVLLFTMVLAAIIYFFYRPDFFVTIAVFVTGVTVAILAALEK